MSSHLGLDGIQSPEVDGHGFWQLAIISSLVRLKNCLTNVGAALQRSGIWHAVGVQRMDVAACMGWHWLIADMNCWQGSRDVLHWGRPVSALGSSDA